MFGLLTNTDSDSLLVKHQTVQHSLFVLLINVGSFPQQQLSDLFPLGVRRCYRAVLQEMNIDLIIYLRGHVSVYHGV